MIKKDIYENNMKIFLLLLLLGSCIITATSKTYITGDSFKSLAHHIFDENVIFKPELVKHADIIFVKTDYLNTFFADIHPKITQKYLLITHNSDKGAPGEFFDILDDEKILFWFGQNPTAAHRKFFTIPIGIANSQWVHGTPSNFDEIITQGENNSQKSYLLGINFTIQTNTLVRKPVYKFFTQRGYCKKLFSFNHREYLQKMVKAEFILSPEGNGLDCHRTWEALLIGTIPIVKTSQLDPLFKDLPVLVVDNWKDVNVAYLKNHALSIKSKNYSREKLYFSYWQKLINDCREALLL